MIGNNYIFLDSVDSTNNYLKDLLKSERPMEGTVVIANEQTAGRGQIGNHWESNSGQNITMSFVLYPTFLDAGNQFMLSKMVSLAIIDFLKEYIDEVKIKWPNDIYIRKNKIAGVLIENSIIGHNISSAIIGIGLNINQLKFSSSLPNPTSLSIETGETFIINQLVDLLVAKLNKSYNKLVSGKMKEIDLEYLGLLYQFMEIHQFKVREDIFNAQIVDVDQFGRLCMLNEKKELLKFAFKEVLFI